MHFNRPVIKRTLPIYRLDNSVFRIGAQLGTTSEFTDPKCEMWDLVQSLNGSEWQTIVKRMKDMHPRLSEKDIEKGLSDLDKLGYVDEMFEDTVTAPRYMANATYFSCFPGASTESAARIQNKLRHSRILLLGLGGGGSNILTLLSGLGIAGVTIVDYDNVEENNLGRQLLYRESDIGRPKVEAAAEALRAMNSEMEIKAINRKIESSEDVSTLIPGNDLVICAVDEPPFLAQRRVNKAIVEANVPCVFGATQMTHGRVFTIVPQKTGCFDCLHLYYTKNDSRFVKQFRGFQSSGFKSPTIAFAPTIWLITSVMVDEAVRLITNYEKPRSLGLQLEIDYPNYTSFPHPAWPRYDECPTCGNGSYDDWEAFKYYGEGV